MFFVFCQEQSTTSSAGNSVSEFEQQNLLMRKNLEDLANLQMQVSLLFFVSCYSS